MLLLLLSIYGVVPTATVYGVVSQNFVLKSLNMGSYANFIDSRRDSPKLLIFKDK
jgi:hypothetical protein